MMCKPTRCKATGRKNHIWIQRAVFSVLSVIGVTAAPATASPEAEAIVKKMLEQKADLLRQAETYVVNERHIFGVQGDMGILQPILFNGWVCLPQRYEYAIELNAKDLNKPAAAIQSFCKTERPVGHSIIRPKEIEYMLMEGR